MKKLFLGITPVSYTHLWMRNNGLEEQVIRLSRDGVTVMGICGGYQMMGNILSDSEGVEAVSYTHLDVYKRQKMSFILTKEQKMIVQLAKTFAETELAPVADEMDKNAKFSPGIVQKVADVGFLGMNVPEEYGGAGVDEVTKALVIMEIAKVDASVAELIAVHTLTNDIILRNGTEEQKQKYLRMACTGSVGAFALTEPNAGSDAASARTKAIIDGDDYVINGSKCFISNMGEDEGDYVILIALTDPAKKTKGMSAIIVAVSYTHLSQFEALFVSGVHSDEDICRTELAIGKALGQWQG